MIAPDLVPFVAFLPLVLVVGYLDLRTLKIPNLAVVASVLVFLVTLPAISVEEALLRAAIAASCFLICFACFWFGLMGGGDAKFLPAVFLFIPSSETALFMFCLAFGLALCILSVVLVRARWGKTIQGWASLQRPGAVPVGFALSVAAVAYLLVPASSALVSH